MRRRYFALMTLFVWYALSGCAAGDANAGPEVVVDTLPNGVVRLRYGALPEPAGEPAAIELSIGAVEGDGPDVFGDVRSIAVDASGNIYVYDYQATEVRVFDPDGAYLRTIGRRGGGPGEITASTGMVFDRNETLWVHDHGKWQMVGFDTLGNEVGRHRIHVLSYGYVFDGVIDDAGRLWKTTSHSVGERVFPPPDGLNEGTSRSYAKWLDPATDVVDSVFLGEVRHRSFVKVQDRGYSMGSIPFTTGGGFAVDRAGGFWSGSRDAYTIVRLDAAGDTTMVIEAAMQPLPVTAEDRRRHVEQVAQYGEQNRIMAEEALAFAPDVHPLIDQLVLDDRGRVFVRRVVPAGENPIFDVFDRGGEYLGAVRLGFQPDTYRPPRIRNDRMYFLVLDSLDVPHVVRTSVPPLGTRTMIGAN